MPAALAVRNLSVMKRKRFAAVVMTVMKSVPRNVMIVEIVTVARENVKNAVWLVEKVPATVFFYFLYALDYVAELKSISTVAMNATNTVSNAVENQVKIYLFFH